MDISYLKIPSSLASENNENNLNVNHNRILHEMKRALGEAKRGHIMRARLILSDGIYNPGVSKLGPDVKKCAEIWCFFALFETATGNVSEGLRLIQEAKKNKAIPQIHVSVVEERILRIKASSSPKIPKTRPISRRVLSQRIPATPKTPRTPRKSQYSLHSPTCLAVNPTTPQKCVGFTPRRISHTPIHSS
ncbi:hypothetical protein ADUPG1_009702, partial [Aduncisulcus paluster]